jgi:hypothetical protein
LAFVPEPLFSRQCQKFFTAVLLRPGSSSLAMAASITMDTKVNDVMFCIYTVGLMALFSFVLFSART